MDELFLFTDGSVNVQSKIGYGAYLVVSNLELPIENLKSLVKVSCFKETSSSKLELQTLLWALSNLESKTQKLIVYTDSQNIIGLPGRHKKFEETNYVTKNNRPIRNKELYMEFFRITRQLDCTFIKVSGHKRSHQKDSIDKLFTLVDTASRRALRDK